MNAFIEKIKQQISNEGLIIYSKSREFYYSTSFSYESLELFLDILATKDYSLFEYQYIWNFYSVCLYYLSSHNPKFRDVFAMKFSLNTFRIDTSKREHLFLLYNIIEFEDKYSKFSAEELQKLNDQLHSFSSPSKNSIEEWLLYSYYDRLLSLFIGKHSKGQESYKEVLSVIAEYSSENELSPFINYLELKNKLLLFRILDITQEKDLNQLSAEYSTILNYAEKNSSSCLSLAIGLKLFDIYKLRNEYNNCLAIAYRTYRTLTKELSKGNKVDYCIEYLLAITTRMAYSNMMLNSKEGLGKSVKKLRKYLKLNDSSTNSAMKEDLTQQYSSCLLFFEQRLNYTGINDKNSPVLSAFKNSFKNAITIETEAIISIFAMNSLDPLSVSYYKLYETNIKMLDQLQTIPLNQIVPTIISVYNSISSLSKSIKSDTNKAKLMQYIDKLRKTSGIVLKYIHNFHLLISFNQLGYIKQAIVQISFCYISANYLQSNYTEAYSDLIKYEQGINKYLHIETDPFISVGNILQLKGSILFQMKEYDKAIECYSNCLRLTQDNGRNEALIKFNLGICYLFLNKRRQGMEYLNRCLSDYSRLYKYNNLIEYQTKYNLVVKILSLSNSQAI